MGRIAKKRGPFRGQPFQRGRVAGIRGNAIGRRSGERTDGVRCSKTYESEVFPSKRPLSYYRNKHLPNQNGIPGPHRAPFWEPTQDQCVRVNPLEAAPGRITTPGNSRCRKLHFGSSSGRNPAESCLAKGNHWVHSRCAPRWKVARQNGNRLQEQRHRNKHL